ncbi:hypothetical protein J3D60_002391 [Pseudomonas sp. S3E17]|nr:hypothetical protein [Pseudomonas sp. S3E17]
MVTFEARNDAAIFLQSRAETLRHVTPVCARAKHPKDTVEHQAIIRSRASAAAGFSEDIGGCIREFIPLCHRGLLAFMAADFTGIDISKDFIQSLSPGQDRGNQAA